MLTFMINFDDKKLFDIVAKQKATLSVGFWDDMYEGVDKPFYSKVAKPNSKTANNPMGKPRRYGVREPISVASVAAHNEYGGGFTPPRPFMRDTINKNWRKWRRFVQDRLPVTLDAKKTMIELGDMVSDDVRTMILTYTTPPNAPSTVRIKGFNKPLVDSGQMSESVRMEVK